MTEKKQEPEIEIKCNKRVIFELDGILSDIPSDRESRSRSSIPCPKCGAWTFAADIDEGYQLLCSLDECGWKQKIVAESDRVPVCNHFGDIDICPVKGTCKFVGWCSEHWRQIDKLLIERNNANTYNQRPVVVTLCGSTKFKDTFVDAGLQETLAGKIVLSIGCNMRTDTEIFGCLPKEEFDETKKKLDELHKRKIDISDEILVLDVGGYIGDSTKSEIAHAIKMGKKIRYLTDEPPIKSTGNHDHQIREAAFAEGKRLGALEENKRVLDQITDIANNISETSEMPCQDGWHTGDVLCDVVRVSYLEHELESLRLPQPSEEEPKEQTKESAK